KSNMQALHDLQADERFNRQALHDIASILFGGLGTPDHAGQDAVGLVIPTCDRPQSLRRALTSVAAQSRRPDKVIVVNDGQERIE
ncbi:glycosyltransferase, partial [Streptomyces caeruleatus]